MKNQWERREHVSRFDGDIVALTMLAYQEEDRDGKYSADWQYWVAIRRDPDDIGHALSRGQAELAAKAKLREIAQYLLEMSETPSFQETVSAAFSEAGAGILKAFNGEPE